MAEAGVNRLVDEYVHGGLSRRQFIVRGLALGLSLTSVAAILEACGAAASPSTSPGTSTAISSPSPSAQGGQAANLSVIGWGSNYGDALAKHVTTPFEAATGAKVLFQEQANASDSLAKLQAEQAHPSVDVWLTTSALPLLLAKAGGLQELTTSNIPNLADLVPLGVQTYQGKTYGAGIHLGANLLIVDKTRIKSFIPDYNADMLKSWSFLYRPELKNQITVPGFAGQYGSHMIGASLIYGGSEKDEEKFFAAMKKLAPNVHAVPPSGIGAPQLFQSKEIVAALGSGSVVQALLKDGASIDAAYPTDPLVVSLDWIVAIKNGPAGGDLANKYINEILRPDPDMAAYDSEIGTLPANTKAVQPVLQGLPPLSVDTLVKSGWRIDYETAIANFDAWNQRYTKEIIPLYGG